MNTSMEVIGRLSRLPKLEHIRSILLSPSDIPCHVNVPASHRSTWRQVYRYVTAITHKPVRNRVVDHDARCIQFNTIPVAEKADGRLGVEQFRILILNNMTNTRGIHWYTPQETVLDLEIFANCFDNNVGLVVELRESRSDSDNRYQQRSFDCLPYQQRPTQLVVGISTGT